MRQTRSSSVPEPLDKASGIEVRAADPKRARSYMLEAIKLAYQPLTLSRSNQ